MIPCKFAETVKNKINESSRKIDEAVKEEPTDYNIYRQTRWEYQVKLSALNAIAEFFCENFSTLKNKDFKEIIVEERHFEAADNFIKIMDKHMENMIEDITLTNEQRIIQNETERIYQKIKASGSNGIKHSDLSRAFPKIHENLHYYINKLLEEERIVHEEYSTMGRRGVLYHDSSYTKGGVSKKYNNAGTSY